MMKLRNLLPLLLVMALAACATVPAPLAPAGEAPAASPAQEAADDAADVMPPPATLFAPFAEPSTTNGDVLILYGQVLDVNGAPLPDAAVEIWQTDASGVYDHPRDPGTDRRDTSFQFYGTATADADGWYAFRTLVPGEYEPRPRHIHFKVKQGDTTLLTSQFYFSGDVAEVADEGMFRAVGESGDLLLLQLVQGDGVLLANGRIVVETGVGAGSLPLTPSQGEGPYYPVVAVAEYDNDLVRLP
jgi:protocatechuate 3,4-dioxygenase beta subunit